MNMSVAGQQFKKGFALPTVLIASVVLLTVLAVSVTATTAARTSLKNQFYAQQAQIAGEAGVAYAKVCLQASGNIPTWTDAKPLTPSTDCNGDLRFAPANVEVLVVAGGGGGGSRHGGGGGGGGFITAPALELVTGSYPVVVGAGGTGTASGAIPVQDTATSGGNSSLLGLVAVGGGAGRGSVSGVSGGSGGGGGAISGNVGGSGTSGQGNTGGAGIFSTQFMGGGGGGAGGVGLNAVFPSNPQPAGGVGLANSITGTSLTYSSGGRGGNYNLQTVAAPGAVNTGNGGGGAGGEVNGGGTGGSGVVIIRYPTGSITATGGVESISGAFTVRTFNGGGTFAISVTTAALNCPTDARCHVSLDGNTRSSFSVARPTVDADGRAVTIPQNGFVELIRESTGAVWRTYRQPSAQPTVAPGLCSGAATSALGWSTAVLTTSSAAFPEPRAQTIGIASGNVNPGPLFFRKDISITDAGLYTVQIKGNGRADLYIDGRLITRTASVSATNTVDVTLAAGCHTIGVMAVNGGTLPSLASIEFALRKKDAALPLVVSDRTWRVAAADTVSWQDRNYYEASPAWSVVRDIGAFNAAPWTGGPGNWATISGDSLARWISTTHNASGTDYPASSFTYLRSANDLAWTFTVATEVQISAACDDSCRIFINGNEVLSASGLVVGTANVTLPAGSHKLSVELRNTGTVVNPSGLLLSARRTADNVVIDRSSLIWSASNAWYSTAQSFASYNSSYRPSPDITVCNCAAQGTTNLAINASVETNLDTITPVVATVARSSVQAFRGSFSAAGTVQTTGFAAFLRVRVNDIEPGLVYRASAHYFAAFGMTMRADFFNVYGQQLSSSGQGTAAGINTWTRMSQTTLIAPAGANYLQIEFFPTVNQNSGSVFYIDGIMVTAGTALRTYADGSSPGWSWVATPNGSPSSGPLL